MPSASTSRIASSRSGIALQIAQPSPSSRTIVIRRGNFPSGIEIDPSTVRIPSATRRTGPWSGTVQSSLSFAMIGSRANGGVERARAKECPVFAPTTNLSLSSPARESYSLAGGEGERRRVAPLPEICGGISMATLANAPLIPAAGDERFFLRAAIVMTVTVVAGFSMQLAMGRSTFLSPPLVHAHAITFMGWVAIYLLQNIFVATDRMSLHRRLGWVAAGWMVAMVILGCLVTAAMVRRGRCPSSSGRCNSSSSIR